MTKLIEALSVWTELINGRQHCRVVWALCRIFRSFLLNYQLLQRGPFLSSTWRNQPDACILSQEEDEGWRHVSQDLQRLFSLNPLLFSPNTERLSLPGISLILYQGGKKGSHNNLVEWVGVYPILNKRSICSSIFGPTFISTSRGTKCHQFPSH